MCFRPRVVRPLLLLALLVLPISWAYALDADRGLGLRPPTPEEQARFDAVSVRVASIPPGGLSAERSRAAVQAAAARGEIYSSPTALPPSVDNSTLSYFPPIRSQGYQGSCTAWATSYYFSTYTQAQDEGYTVSGGDNTHICSPGFMYNLINGGANNGSSIPYAMLKLSEAGCASWADMPYALTNDPSDYLTWPSETAWVGALRNRTSTPHTLDLRSPSDRLALKQRLANGTGPNGGVAVVSMSVYQTWYGDYNMADAKGISNGVYYAADGSYQGGHALTVVGYDDNRSYVDHRDAQTHYGAFLIANSWGSGWGLQNSTGSGGHGFFWAAYTAFADGTMDPIVYYNDDRPHYRPSLYVVVGLNQPERDTIALSASVGYPAVWQSDNVLSGDGGAYPISDTDAVAVDMTDGAGFIVSPPTLVAARLQLSSAAATAATITRADFYEDLDGNGSYAVHSSSDPTVTVSPNSTDLATLSLIPSSGQDCDVTGVLIPDATEWEVTTPSVVTVRNLGTSAWPTGAGYMLSRQDPVNRWGVTLVPLGASVAAGNSYDFSFDLIAPPVTTLAYTAPVTDTAPGGLDELPLDLAVMQNSTLLVDGTAAKNIVISRFQDIQPGTLGAWARFFVEECAGRLPLIVSGYPDGSYRPTLAVDRATMAVFMQRAMNLPLGSYAGYFTDVPIGFWADDQIQSCVDAGIVGGYADGTYRPTGVVTRDTMAVFIARGLAGGDTLVPPGPGSATFPDVTTGSWAFKYVEYAVDNGVTGGYPDGTYRPSLPVDRSQMAVFVYRGFVQSHGSVIVLAGPAVTATDPATGGQCGWTSAVSGAAANPGYAYVAFDAIRLGSELAVGGTWDVTLELRLASDPGTPATGNYLHVVSYSDSQISSLRDTAKASGDPYCVISWDLPAGLTPGNYLFVVSAEDSTGTMREIARKPAFTITP